MDNLCTNVPIDKYPHLPSYPSREMGNTWPSKTLSTISPPPHEVLE